MGVKFLKLSVVIFEENKVNSYLTKVVSSCSASSHQLETCILLSFGPLTPRLEYRRATPKGVYPLNTTMFTKRLTLNILTLNIEAGTEKFTGPSMISF